MKKPEVLSENWLPLAELGIESRRENSVGKHPPPNRLHVWWARRPLTVSRAAILGGILPSWEEDWPEELRKKFDSKKEYYKWFMQFIGIKGDPIEAKRKIEEANKKGIRLDENPYGYRRAFQQIPDYQDLELFNMFIDKIWKSRELNFLDPMAGGGSIPLEAVKFGLNTNINELNPVAAVILKATVQYTKMFSKELASEIRKYGEIWCEQVNNKLKEFYPVEEGNSIHAYLWARTIPCPSTGKPVPLSPNWWLRKGSDPVAVKPICKDNWDKCKFELLRGKEARKSKPNNGTVSRGDAQSPWTGETIPLAYIHEQGKEGNMGEQLYAVAIKKRGGMDFRSITDEDLEAIERAKKEYRNKLSDWEYKDLIPNESIPEGYTTEQPKRYGITTWREMFSPRQLFAECTFLETLKEVQDKVYSEIDDSIKGKAIITYLGIALDKTVDYNSRLTLWDSTRDKVGHTFDRHDFSFKWSHGEFDAARNLLPWALEQIIDAYEGISDLITNKKEQSLFDNELNDREKFLNITKGNASNLSDISNNSLDNICIDPPYYDNVFYSESSDFFYVWMKRALGDVYPELFEDELTNKDEEAVANPARFSGLESSKKKELAKKDYERKMKSVFKEMNRILKSEGVLTVMFTHKKTEAWNTLARSLIEAGFSIQSSWPVHTEGRHSLHQANKNAAASTILLVCRKREDNGQTIWWEDLQSQIRRTVQEKAKEYQNLGIDGVDLQLAIFGPTLSIISENWPVLTSKADPDTGKPIPLEPETALDIAREEIFKMRKEKLLGDRDVEFDPITDWYILAWDIFEAQQFPADEGRKLAFSLNLDIEQDIKSKKVTRKSGRFLKLRTPDDRTFKGLVDQDQEEFDCFLDAVHTAMYIYDNDGSGACRRFLEMRNFRQDTTFRSVIQAMINAIPRRKDKNDEFVREEAETLNKMRLAFFDDIEVPEEEKAEEQAMSLHQLADDEE